jgi:hypothetical protein
VLNQEHRASELVANSLEHDQGVADFGLIKTGQRLVQAQ